MYKNKSNRWRTFCLLLFCLAIVTKSAAQAVRLSGSVFSNGQKPLQGAIVTLYPSKTIRITDQAGHFFFNAVPKDCKILTVGYFGYEIYKI